MKQCSKCKEIKPYDQFGKMSKAHDGYYPSCKQCKSAYAKKHYATVLKHDPVYMERQRINTAKNEARIKSDPTLLEEHKEYRREWHKKRYKINKDDPVYMQLRNLRSIVATAMRGKYYGPKQEAIIGLPFQEFREYIESQFDSDMSWDNYATHWEIHHIVPASKHSSSMSLLELLFYYKNMMPLPKWRNAEIGDTIDPSLLTEWHIENLSGLIS